LKAGYGSDLSFADHDVMIRTARPIDGELSLDKEGFTLAKRRATSLNERDPETFKRKYLEVMIPFTKDYFKASGFATANIAGVRLRSRSKPLPWGDNGRRRWHSGKPATRTIGAGYAHSPGPGLQIAVSDSKLREGRDRPQPPYSRPLLLT